MTKDPQPKRKPENCAFVIFGVTGDLTHRLVMPSLYNLAAEKILSAMRAGFGGHKEPKQPAASKRK